MSRHSQVPDTTATIRCTFIVFSLFQVPELYTCQQNFATLSSLLFFMSRAFAVKTICAALRKKHKQSCMTLFKMWKTLPCRHSPHKRGESDEHKAIVMHQQNRNLSGNPISPGRNKGPTTDYQKSRCATTGTATSQPVWVVERSSVSRCSGGSAPGSVPRREAHDVVAVTRLGTLARCAGDRLRHDPQPRFCSGKRPAQNRNQTSMKTLLLSRALRPKPS